MTLKRYLGIKGEHATNPVRAREARHNQARTSRAEKQAARREKRRKRQMDPIIAVYNLKLTARSSDSPDQIVNLTNETVGEACADALVDLLAEGGVTAEVNVTSIERTDDD